MYFHACTRRGKLAMWLASKSEALLSKLNFALGGKAYDFFRGMVNIPGEFSHCTGIANERRCKGCPWL